MEMFQACKGTGFSASHQITNGDETPDRMEEHSPGEVSKVETEDDIKLVSEDTFKVPFGPDMLIVYAAVEGKQKTLFVFS